MCLCTTSEALRFSAWRRSVTATLTVRSGRSARAPSWSSAPRASTAASTLPHSHADVVVGAVAVETPGGPGPPGPRCRRRSGTSPSRISRIVIAPSATSDLAELAGEVLDQRVEHADHHALAHRRGLAGDLRVRVDRAAAVVRAGTSTSAFAWPCPPASRDLTRIDDRCAAASCSTISTVPVNVIDIAPILTSICAFTESGPVVSSTLPPSTHGTTRSRSVIAAKLSSIGLARREGMVQLYGHVRLSSVFGTRI